MNEKLEVDPAYACSECGAQCEDLLSPVCNACRQKMTLVPIDEYKRLQARIAKLRWALGRSANQGRAFKKEINQIEGTGGLPWRDDDFEAGFETEDYSGCVRGLDDDEWMVWLRDVNQEIFDLRTHGVLDRASGKALIENMVALDQKKKANK